MAATARRRAPESTPAPRVRQQPPVRCTGRDRGSSPAPPPTRPRRRAARPRRRRTGRRPAARPARPAPCSTPGGRGAPAATAPGPRRPTAPRTWPCHTSRSIWGLKLPVPAPRSGGIAGRFSRVAGNTRGAERVVEQTLSRLRALDTSSAAEVPGRPLTLEDLYRQHRARMVRLAVLLVDDPATAEDVVQEAFTGLYRNWSGLRDAKAAVAYLRTAVVNSSRS